MAVTGLRPAGAPQAHRPAALGPKGPRRWAGACNLSLQLLCPPVSAHTRDGASLTGPATVTYGVRGVGPEERPAPGEAGRCCGPPRLEAGPLCQKHPGQVVSCLWTLSDKPAVNTSVATHDIMVENWDRDETGGNPQRGGGVGRDRGSFGAKPRHRRGWERPGLSSGSLQGPGAGGGSPLKSERGAAEQSCAHRGPAPGSVGGSGYSLMWPWQGCRPHVLQLPVPMLGSQQSLLPSTRGWGSGWGGADLHIRLAMGCRDGSPAWRQRPRAGGRQPLPTPPASLALSQGAQKMKSGGTSPARAPLREERPGRAAQTQEQAGGGSGGHWWQRTLSCPEGQAWRLPSGYAAAPEGH